MLEYLHVKNLALLEECELHFEKGLNILTGETGAGKSVLMGSVNLALGARADRDMIGQGAEEALVELCFSLNDESVELLNRMDISSDSDSVFISRKITPSRNIFKINGEIATAKQIKELAAVLLDIHGQHEHQSLLSNIRQRDMMDAFGGSEIEKLISEVKECAIKYTRLKEEYEEALNLSEGREREISLLRYECEEIENANLVPGEDEELEADYNRMKSAEKILSLTNEAMAYVSNDSGEDASGLISRAIQCMKRVANYDEQVASMTDKLSLAEEMLGDFVMELSAYTDKLDFSMEDFVSAEERLNDINSLKSRFGNTIEAILNNYEEKSRELEKLENLDQYLANLKRDMDMAKDAYFESGKRLSEKRKTVSKEFSDKLTSELKELSFLDVKFEVIIDSDYELVSSKGFDTVEYMISTNPGQPLRPMKNVASGGELSRIMLAVKTILAKEDNIDALIFDEIDAGISGRTAWEVARKLNKLSKNHQVISITHLAQIAAMADSHYEIAKIVDNNKTLTVINKLDEEGEIRELGRLLGSSELGEASLSNAKELKNMAVKEKENTKESI